MNNTIIWRHIQKIDRSLIWRSIIGIALLLAIGVLQYRYLRNCFLGPQKIDSKQLMRINNLESLERDYITFTSPKTIEIDFKKIINKHSEIEIPTQKHIIVLVGTKKALLVKVQPDYNPKNCTFTGGLSEIAIDTQIQIIPRLIQKIPALKGKILPFMLETGDYRLWSYFLVPLLLSGLGICSWQLYQAKIRSNPRRHPVYPALAKYGDVDTLTNSIDREISDRYNINSLKSNTFYLTQSWLIFSNKYDLQIMHLDQLMWVYKKGNKRRMKFIPTGKSHEISLHDRLGQEQTIKSSKKQVNEIIIEIAGYAPWAIVGFDPEVEVMWDDRRDDFYQLVAQRQQEYKSTN